MPHITKKTIDHLASLARLRLTDAESKKFLKDMDAIIGYVEELKKLDTKGSEAMIGGTTLKNIFREDTVDLDRRARAVDEAGSKIGRAHV